MLRYSILHLRSDFLTDCFFFRSSLSNTFARGIFVLTRFLTGCNASVRRVTSLSTASFLLVSWLRVSETSNWIWPSALILEESTCPRISFCEGENKADAATSQINVTRVSTLLTCCPPAPLEREVLKINSFFNASTSTVIKSPIC